MIEPFPGRLGVSTTPCGLEIPDIIESATFSPVRGESDEETAIFEADLSELEAGAYNLCYCSEDDYEPLQYTEFSSALVMDTLGDAAADLCINKCATGCVGPTCFCDGYDGADVDTTSNALCLGNLGCMEACDSTAGCDGFMIERNRPRCFLVSSSSEPIDSQVYHAFSKSNLVGLPCSNLNTSFTATTVSELFDMSIGILTVTKRMFVGVDFVVTPGETTSLEVAGKTLTSADQIMIVECSAQCGLAEPSAAVTQPGRPVDALYDPASKMEGGPPTFPADLDPTPFATGSAIQTDTYCKGNNIDVASSDNRLVAEHQCYKKCEAEAPCTEDYCFCDGLTGGFFPGYDQADSTALCLPQASCESLCSMLPECGSIDMHKTKDRCFLNTVDCFDGSGYASPLWATDENYNHIQKTSILRLEDMEAIGKSFTEADIRKLIAPQDYGLSWALLNRYEGVVFETAGTYKVCGCDSEVQSAAGVTSPCSTADQFSVDIGKVHVSGLQCLLGKPEFARGTCVAQEYGGLRCYQDGAPDTSSPYDELGVPAGLYSGSPYLLGAPFSSALLPPGTSPAAYEKVRLFCTYGTDTPYMYDFCATVMGTDYVPPTAEEIEDDVTVTPAPTTPRPTPEPTFSQLGP